MPADRTDTLGRVAEAVSDGTPVDWGAEIAERPELAEALRQLSLLERVRDVHGGSARPLDPAWARTEDPPDLAEATDDPEPPFSWGRLRVLEQVGKGNCVVYRAHDPTLQTDVALKLRRRGPRSQAHIGNLIAEARRLARVHHPNVLVVHGADEHEGRMGIWTELIRGMSLERYIQQTGPLGAREATLIGLDLCRALSAVHAAGLVHRDVKTANVMREEGGRIVLMDFGSMGEIPSLGAEAKGHIYGTAIAMAPEQLRGEVANPASDIYGLGVLLYRLVSGRYPIEADTFADLVEKHRRGERVALRDRRPDLPLDFVEVVERALSPDSSARYGSAGEMERALSRTLGAGHVPVGPASPEPEPRPEPRRRSLLVAMIGAFTLGGIVLLMWGLGVFPARRDAPDASSSLRSNPPDLTPTPRPPSLTATVSLFRRSGTRNQPLPPTGGRIAPGDRLSIAVQGSEPLHAYVLNEDFLDSVYVLFPIPGLTPTNPLAAGVRYRLPGQMGDSLVYWTVTTVGGREMIAVIASREPLIELEQVIARVPRAAPGRPVRYGTVNPSLLGFRGIGGLQVEGKVSAKSARGRLEDAIRALSERAHEKGDVWVWEAHLENPGPSP